MKPDPGNASAIGWQSVTSAPVRGAVTRGAGFADESESRARVEKFLRSATEADECILLVINDPNRSTRTREILRSLGALVRSLKHGTGTCPRFQALIATGTHQHSPHRRTEFERTTLGHCGVDIDQTRWHDAEDDATLADVGGASVNQLIDQHRYLLPIGSVEPHYFAGLTGPHKTVTIGCMSFDGIQRNHEHALDPKSDILKLKGNPVHRGISKTLDGFAQAGKVICAIGQVVCNDHITATATGNPLDVVDALLPAARKTFVRGVDHRADILRLRVPSPLGDSFYQADKALKNNHLAVRNGGGIILEANCSEGVGPDAFMELLRTTGNYEDAVTTVKQRGYRLGDHKGVKLRHLMDPSCRGVRVVLVTSNLADSQLRGTGIGAHLSVDGAMQWILDHITQPVSRGLIVEDAGMVCVAPKGE